MAFDADVLVVGAGPVGLALAGDLGWRGRTCIVLERGTGAIYQPKMDMVGIRTMEFCRRWNIVGDVEGRPHGRSITHHASDVKGVVMSGAHPVPRNEPAAADDSEHRESS